MDIEPFTLPPVPGSTLKMTAKRYSTARSRSNKRGLTFIFTHCIGGHKEQWEPVISRLLAFDDTIPETNRPREAWSFDWQSHGQAAVVNREALKAYPGCVSAYEWAPAIKDFITSPRMLGHRIVGVGHSAGAAALLLSTKDLELEKIPYISIILVEPVIVPRAMFDLEREERMSVMDSTVAATSARRDHWKSRQAAFEYFQKRLPWMTWDARVIRLLTEHGLEDDPTGGVRLKWEKEKEAASYPDVEPHFEGPGVVARICKTIPIHLVWGERYDLVPQFIRDSVSDVKEGYFVASVRTVEDAGHMVVQEKPDDVARTIQHIIGMEGHSQGQLRSKL